MLLKKWDLSSLKYFFITFYLIFAPLSWGEVFYCELNGDVNKTEVTEAELKKLIQNFSFNYAKDKAGVIKNISNFTFKIFRIDERIYIDITNDKLGSHLVTHYSINQKDINIKLNKTVQLNCSRQMQVDSIKLKTGFKLEDSTKINNIGNLLTFFVNVPLTFEYSNDPNQMMSEIYFKNGRVFYERAMQDKSTPWCILRVRLKLNQNANMRRATKLTPLEYVRLESGKNDLVFAYRFDSLKGSPTYSPFNLQCKFEKSRPFTIGEAKKIFGKYVRFELKK